MEKDKQLIDINFYGLYEKGGIHRLPLLHVDFEIEASYSYAKIGQTLTFKNTNPDNHEAVFYFPQSIKSSISEIQVFYGDLVATSSVMLKQVALTKFEHAKQEGQTAMVLTQQSRVDGVQRADCMRFDIANLKPDIEVKVKISIIQELTRSANRLQVKIPANIPALYVPLSIQSPSSLKQDILRRVKSWADLVNAINSNYPEIEAAALINESRTVSAEFSWSFNLKVYSAGTHYHAESLTHSNLEFVRAEKIDTKFTVYFYRLPTNGKPAEKDFIFSFADSLTDAAILNIAKWEDNSTTPYALSSCFEVEPQEKLTHSQFDDEFKAEYLFLLDRSGSMDGDPIKMAKEALVYALKSLPDDSYFNIISFGSNWSAMFTESVCNSDEVIDDTIRKISKIQADMGGTEIFPPIKFSFSSPQVQGRQKNIFLLTDGFVSNVNQIVGYIERNTVCHRVFCLGIGSGFSEALIEGSAKAGNGAYDSVAKSESIPDAVISLIEKSFGTCSLLRNLHLVGAQSEFISPTPDSTFYLFKHQRIEVNALIKSFDWTQDVSLRYEIFHPKSGKSEHHKIIITEDMVLRSSAIHKLAATKLSNQLSYLLLEAQSKLRTAKSNLEDLQEIGVANKVLNSTTGLLVVFEKNPEAPKDATQIQVPSIEKKKEIISENIYVKTLTGKTITITINLQETVDNLKMIIEDEEGIPASEQRLVWPKIGKSLQGDEILSDIGIEPGSILFLVLRLRGDGYTPDPPSIKILEQATNTLHQDIFKISYSMKWRELFDVLAQRFTLPVDRIVLKIGERMFGLEQFADKRISFRTELDSEGYQIVTLIDKAQTELGVGGLLKIIAKQSSRGCWQFDQSFADWLANLGLLEIEADAPQTDLWMTQRVAAILRKDFAAEEGKWKLVAKKADNWILKNSQA